MDAFLALVVGAVIGWVGSLVFRTATPTGIVLDIAAGMFGAMAGALLFGSDYHFDIIMAAGLGAMFGIALLTATRRLSRLERSRTDRQ